MFGGLKALRLAMVMAVMLPALAHANETAGEGAGLRPTVSAGAVSEAVTPVSSAVTLVSKSGEAGAGPGCARKVKVVYAGYGEAQRAGCNLATAGAANPGAATR